MATHDPELRKELDATLQTRKELGPEYEAELLESFLEKLDRGVEQRVRRQLAEQQVQVARGARPPRPGGDARGMWERFGFAAFSLVLAVPLSAIAAAYAGDVGLLLCWAGIVGVNAVQSGGARRLPRPGTSRDGAAPHPRGPAG
ncbi:hypothetical protein AB0G60_26225 [Streptomyces angustmyceticus]|uniref:Integral membrane protein n=1 Tax=Streptomyces angustmyceticus TaxID=285578 RepID=A0A5J4LPD5_9ACTN|nr:hypothetical protein [Streptomyces angustmyceticus]UAL68855.1 hypothetical protein K7396_21900 [Streptomyces angustmyceticus]GES32215.1 hypothetical protein San01_47020 [Streptomyces angustmyceticus]